MHLYIKYLLVSYVLLAPVIGAADITAPQTADVRVVIDISGSMKKTDPTNLRQPAVDLIVRLLPDQSKAGLWTFGQSVNMLVPHRVVDARWRAEGAQKADAINSVALFTNIGNALEVATAGSAAAATDYRRHLILLTDGVVDISKDAVVNLLERQRILTELLPQLKASDYRIHTIALSADADQELMRKLSIETGGIFEVANSADELMAIFLRIFDHAVPSERVPLDDNGFMVDSSIEEFTALIFRGAEVPATIIAAPDGKEYSATDPTNNVNWYRTDKYDLITVQQPAAGQWQVKTAMAAGSRVTVVSNLQWVVEPLPSNIKLNQRVNITHTFISNNETLTNSDFLNLLTGEVFLTPVASKETIARALAKVTVKDGVFTDQITGFTTQGAYDIRILIDGKTFKREFVHRINVNESAFRVEKKVDQVGDKKTYTYKVFADLDVVDVARTVVTATMTNSLANNLVRELNAIEKNYWEFSFTPLDVARYEIALQVNGMQIDGSPLREVINIDNFFYPDEAAVLAAQIPAGSASSEAPPPATGPDVAEQEQSNLWLYSVIGAANILVLVLAFIAYRIIAGKGSRIERAEMENTLNFTQDALNTDTAKTSEPEKVSEFPVRIDVADAEPAHIPMEDNSAMDLAVTNDVMADNLFPLDDMSDDNKKDKN